MKFSCAHDFHVHSFQSKCCSDERMTPAAIAAAEAANNVVEICLTDHVWSPGMGTPNGFYEGQDVPHIRESLPLPQTGVRFLFGAETDYIGGRQVGLTRAEAEALDWVLVPVNHFHMGTFTVPAGNVTPAQRALLYAERLEELLGCDLPWEKVGLAHPTCQLGFREDPWAMYALVDEKRVRRALCEYAKRGVSFELQAGCFADWETHPDEALRLYRWAKDAGCRFHLGSDAHTVERLAVVPALFPAVTEALGLTDDDRRKL